MKIEVNHDKCIGCGMCVNTDSENFDYDTEGYIIAINNNITDATNEAKNYCPTDAISFIEDKKEEK